jgi:hypothetical protein
VKCTALLLLGFIFISFSTAHNPQPVHIFLQYFPVHFIWKFSVNYTVIGKSLIADSIFLPISYFSRCLSHSKICIYTQRHLATDVRPASSGIYRHELLEGSYDIAILSMAIFFPQLQLCDLPLRIWVQPVRDLHAQMPSILPFLSDVDYIQIAETNYHLGDVDHNNKVRIPV